MRKHRKLFGFIAIMVKMKTMARGLLGKKQVTVRAMDELTKLVISGSPAVGRCARFYTRFGMEGTKEAISDRPSSEVYNIMIQARGLVELMGFRKVSLKAQNIKDYTFRGTPEFGMRICYINKRSHWFINFT